MRKRLYIMGVGWVDARPQARPKGPFIVPDLPEYKSPLGTGVISGRAARREELKRAGCREVDPSEWKPMERAELERRKAEALAIRAAAPRKPGDA